MLIGIDNFSEGHKTQLYKSLESVANSAHKSVAAVEKLGYTLLNFGVAEKGGYEFTAAVGLVAARKTAGNEYHLSVGYFVGKGFDAVLNSLGRQVVYDKYLGFSACVGNGLCAVEFTVCAGEGGNENLGLCGFYCRGRPAFRH